VYRDKSKSQQVIYFGLKSFRERRETKQEERKPRETPLPKRGREEPRRIRVVEDYEEEFTEETTPGGPRGVSAPESRAQHKFGRIRISNKEFLYIEGFEDPSCPTCEL
jgi:hypothetical protein